LDENNQFKKEKKITIGMFPTRIKFRRDQTPAVIVFYIVIVKNKIHEVTKII